MNRKCGVCGGAVCPHCGHTLKAQVPGPRWSQAEQHQRPEGRGATWSINQALPQKNPR